MPGRPRLKVACSPLAPSPLNESLQGRLGVRVFYSRSFRQPPVLIGRSPLTSSGSMSVPELGV